MGGQAEGGRPPTGNQRRSPQPLKAASMVAMSIFLIVIIASNARLAAARSELVNARVSAIGGVGALTPPIRSTGHAIRCTH